MLRPNGPRVLVLRRAEPKPESSLLIIPETVDEKPSKFAVVLAVGKLTQGGIEVGDTVVMKDYAGSPVNVLIDGQQHEAYIVEEESILAVLEGETA